MFSNYTRSEAMEDNARMIESLIERAAQYSVTSIELVKLKALDKTSDVVSTIVPQSVLLYFIATILLFVNVGLALWLGEVLGKIFYGFFVVAAFYGISGIIFRLFLYTSLKNRICNKFIKQVLK